MAEELPWLIWLPAEERPQAISELLDNLLAGVDTREFGPFLRTLSAWRCTAIAWSDPDTARRLAAPFDGTGGEVIGRPDQWRSSVLELHVQFPRLDLSEQVGEAARWQREVAGFRSFAVSNAYRILETGQFNAVRLAGVRAVAGLPPLGHT